MKTQLSASFNCSNWGNRFVILANRSCLSRSLVYDLQSTKQCASSPMQQSLSLRGSGGGGGGGIFTPFYLQSVVANSRRCNCNPVLKVGRQTEVWLHTEIRF